MQTMSRKQKLSKRIAHTILAMSIVYSGGLNVLCNTAFAADNGADGTDSVQTDIVAGNGGYNETFTGTAGGDGSDTSAAGEDSGSGGKGGNASASGTITAQDAANDIKITATGGAGGRGGAIGASSLPDEQKETLGTHTGASGDGGSAKIDFAVQDMQTKVLTLTATGGEGGAGQNGYAPTTEFGAGGSGGDATITLKVAGTDLQANSITLTAKGGDGKASGLKPDGMSNGRDNSIGGAAGKGGDVQNEGLVLSGSSSNVVVAANINITGKGGSGAGSASAYGVSGAGGIAGAANVYGLTCVDAGIFTASFANLIIEATGGAGGGNGSTDISDRDPADSLKANAAAAGGTAEGYGVRLSGGQLTVSGTGVSSKATGGNAGNGTSLPKYANNDVTGLGENNGGQAIAVGVKGSGGQLLGTLTAKITATATGGNGGRGHYINCAPDGTKGTDEAPNGTDGGAALASGLAGGSGGNAYAAAVSMAAGSMDITVSELKTQATGGNGGDGGNGSPGGDGGSGKDSSAVGETGGNGGNASNSSIAGSMGGSGGTGYAAALYNTSKDIIKITAGKIEVIAVGGKGGGGGRGASGGRGGNGGEGISDSSIGGDGGDGGNGGNGGTGGTGGTGYAAGLYNSQGGKIAVTADSITATATGGYGGYGGYGSSGGNGGSAGHFGVGGVYGTDGNAGNGGNGGNGGIGGNAYAQGVYGSQGSTTSVSVDLITAKATVGNGGTKGNGYSTGTAGTDGKAGAEAKAYGVYAESGAVINLSARTEGGTIKIGAKAVNGTVANEAYAVYADGATVLFHNNATLNTSDGTTADDTVVTYLNNATLGFSGTDVGRQVEGGTLQLAGSNTFRVNTDLGNAVPTADKFTFAKLADGSSTDTQFITVGYDKAFDGGNRVDSVTGTEVTVLTITDLNGQSLNFTGKASTLDDPLTRFMATPTVVTSGNDVKISQIDFEDIGASETVMTLADSQMALGSMWRIEGNNLMKRMGDLRSDSEAAKGGVWARYYRGELSANSSYDRDFSQDYTAFQGGIDKVQDYKGGKLYTGIAVNRIDSNMGYSAGSGDLSSTGVGVYTSWLGSTGHYFDVIARGSKLNNDMKLVDMSGNSAKADYSTWAYGISAEYGYRQELQAGWFVEPQAEVSLGHINSVDYTTSNGVGVKQDGVNSAVTRLGVVGGKEFTINNRPSNAYIKASVLHDFGGNGGATAYYGTDSLAMQAGDLMGTWYEVGVGMNLSVAKNSNLYFDALKTFKGSIRTDWQINAGLRFSF